MDVNVNHLSLSLGGGIGDAASNLKTAQDFVVAVDDRELAEAASLMSPSCHLSTFSGVVRGRGAAAAVLESEYDSLRLVWETKVIQLTADTFERRGKVLFLNGRLHSVASLPFVREVTLRLMQHPVIEHIVVGRDGLVLFRGLGYKWRLGVEW